MFRNIVGSRGSTQKSLYGYRFSSLWRGAASAIVSLMPCKNFVCPDADGPLIDIVQKGAANMK